jgi:hypothetical protein
MLSCVLGAIPKRAYTVRMPHSTSAAKKKHKSHISIYAGLFRLVRFYLLLVDGFWKTQLDLSKKDDVRHRHPGEFFWQESHRTGHGPYDYAFW